MAPDRPAGRSGGEGADLGALTFEELLEELERLTAVMAAGEVGIEEAADLYERAGEVYRAAAERLDRVSERINALRSSPPGPAGQPPG